MAGRKNNLMKESQLVRNFDFSAFGKLGGRPRKFNSPEEFEMAISRYFGSITTTRVDPERKDNNGDPVLITELLEPPTITSLCNYLDISKDTWATYAKKEGYSDAASRARQIIEAYLEQQLLTAKQTQGIIFNLKNNFGWAEKIDMKQEVNANVRTVESFLSEEDGEAMM